MDASRSEQPAAGPPPGIGATADRLTSMTGSAWPINPVCPWCGGSGVATVMGVAVDDCCHPFGSPGAQLSPE